MIISHIVAAAENGVIGKDNDMVWRISNDFKHFKKTTTGHCMVMGRKNYESIGTLLPNRTSIIVTRDPNYTIDGAIMVNSIDGAIEKARELNETELFIIGGGEIYKQTYDIIDKLYLTVVHATPEGDTFYVDYNLDDFEILNQQTFQQDEKNQHDHTIYELRKK